MRFWTAVRLVMPVPVQEKVAQAPVVAEAVVDVHVGEYERNHPLVRVLPVFRPSCARPSDAALSLRGLLGCFLLSQTDARLTLKHGAKPAPGGGWSMHTTDRSAVLLAYHECQATNA